MTIDLSRGFTRLARSQRDYAWIPVTKKKVTGKCRSLFLSSADARKGCQSSLRSPSAMDCCVSARITATMSHLVLRRVDIARLLERVDASRHILTRIFSSLLPKKS